MQRADSVKKTLILGKTEGRRRRGRQRMRWLDGIIHLMDMSLSNLREIVRDRGAWHAIVHGVTKSQTRSVVSDTSQPYVKLKLQYFGHLMRRVPLLVSYHFAFSYCSWCSQGKNTEVTCHSLLQWTILSDLSTMTCPSWVAPWAWLGFIELDKAVVLVWLDWLVFCEYGFSVSALWCPLATPTILLGFLLPWTWGYLFTAAP